MDRNGEIVQTASFRIPRDTWQRFREIVASEHRSTSDDLRRYIEGRIAEADEVAA